MLNRLTVKNFRKLRDATFEFTKGLNVVRGVNEAGKSTMLEALTYAFFGVSACRTPLADMVTWGEKDSTLRAELVFEISGTTYTIKRSKSGCEVTYGGERVVGQTECAAFIGRLFGVSTKNVNRLILSGQGNIRGALSEGSTKTAELIEQLANFSVIDDVIELIGTNLTTGATAPFEEKAAALTVELEALEAALVPPDTAADEARLAELEQTVQVITEETESIMTAVLPIAAKRDKLRAAATEKAKLEERVSLLAGQSVMAQAAMTKLDNEGLEGTWVMPNAPRVEKLQAGIRDHVANQKRLAGKEIVERTYYNEDNFFEGDMAACDAERARCGQSLRDLGAKKAKLESDIKVGRAQMILAASCGACGKDVSTIPEVMEKNRSTSQNIASAVIRLSELQADEGAELATFKALEQCQTDHYRIQLALVRFGADVRWDTDVVPHRPHWAYAAMSGLVDPIAAQTELEGLLAAQKRYDAWETRVDVQKLATASAEQAWLTAQAKLDAGFPGLDELPALEAECERLNALYTDLHTSFTALAQERGETDARIVVAKAAYATALARVEAVRMLKAEADKTITDICFNNALKKRVQAARPIIANKLWSMVLTAVSNYFSQMRGSASVVTKDTEGFKVDGKIIEGLSGSTLDILGLGIRLALVRTFLPQTPLLILDEPSAACDDARTESMMAFLVSCGFDQMLLVTHETFSSSAAESLIEI